MNARISERRKAKKKPEEAVTVASSSLFAPSWRDRMFPAPIPIVNPIAWIIAMIENTMPTAPAALVPSFATKYVSAVL